MMDYDCMIFIRFGVKEGLEGGFRQNVKFGVIDIKICHLVRY